MAILLRRERHFRRALGFLWPHRRYLVTALICSVGVALAYSTSIGAILPVLKLMIAEEGVRGYVYRHAAMERLGAGLRLVPHRAAGADAAGPPEAYRVVVGELGPDSPLGMAGVESGYRIDLTPGTGPVAGGVLELLATAPDDGVVTLGVWPPGSVEPSVVELRPPPLPAWWDAAVRTVRWLPLDASNRSRLITLAFALGIILLINIAGNACRFGAEYLVLLSAARAMMDFRRQMYAKVLTLPMTWFSRNLSETMSRFVQDSQDIFRGYVVLFSKLAREPLKALAVFILAMWLDYRVTLAVVVGGPIAAVILYRLGKQVRKANQRLLVGYGRMIGNLSATLSGMRVVRAYTREGYERQRLWQVERNMLKESLKMSRIEAMTSPLIEVIGVTLAMVGIVWLAHRTMVGEASPAKFIQMVVLMVAMFDPVRKVATVYNRIQRAEAASQRIFAVLDMPGEQLESTSQRELPAPKRSIEFVDVSYTYPESDTPAVAEVSLTVPIGRKVAIVGPNGSGKTTLISLLLRFFDPQQGRILIDGVDIRTVGIKSLRRHFSLITQDAVVFAMSVAENIGYGREGATRDEIIEAAKRAHADEFIRQMPDGYDTVVGEFGATLSGGQRQRISLARAILRDAPIFIFDEATSQVDVESEQRIREAMTECMIGRTTFVIAHRIATVQQADQIVVMDEGRIDDVGSHDELIARCELYRSLYTTHLHGRRVEAPVSS